MKKLYLASLLTVGLSISAFAGDIVPQNQQGTPTDPRLAGSKTCVIDVSTNTNAVLCAAGAGVIIQVIPSTTTADIIVFRDSATANTTSTRLEAIGGVAAATINTHARFYNGLSANLLTAGGTWTVIYAQPK